MYIQYVLGRGQYLVNKSNEGYTTKIWYIDRKYGIDIKYESITERFCIHGIKAELRSSIVQLIHLPVEQWNTAEVEQEVDSRASPSENEDYYSSGSDQSWLEAGRCCITVLCARRMAQ